jgi:hypothetical protein
MAGSFIKLLERVGDHLFLASHRGTGPDRPLKSARNHRPVSRLRPVHGFRNPEGRSLKPLIGVPQLREVSPLF